MPSLPPEPVLLLGAFSIGLIVLAGIIALIGIWGHRHQPEPERPCSNCGAMRCTSMECMAAIQTRINQIRSLWPKGEPDWKWPRLR